MSRREVEIIDYEMDNSPLHIDDLTNYICNKYDLTMDPVQVYNYIKYNQKLSGKPQIL